MAAAIFEALSTLRFAIETETDADSPDNETTYKAIRGAIEALFKLCFSDGFTGTASANPPNDTTGVLTHAGAAQGVDEHNGRTLVITSGLARGNFYTIDDTAAQTITCTGDNLYSDGVRSGDYFEIFYDIKTNADGHDHDGVNAKGAYVADAAIGQAKLKTTTGSVDYEGLGGGAWNLETLPGGEYGFYPQVKGSGAGIAFGAMILNEDLTITTGYITNISLYATGVGQIVYAQQRYVQASGEVHWIFILINKSTGKVISMWQAPDHPCFGNRGIVHPFGSFDPVKHEIIVVNPTLDEVEKIRARTLPAEGGGWLTREKIAAGIEEDYFAPARDFIEVFEEMYEIEESKEAAWPNIPVTIALPNNWNLLPLGSKIQPVRRVIKRPDYITPLKIKEKRAAKI